MTERELPVLRPFDRLPQDARRNGFLENIEEEKRHMFPDIRCTAFMLNFYLSEASITKHGESKPKMFPTAAKLQTIRHVLECSRRGEKLVRPVGLKSAIWSQFKSDCKKDYAIDERSGALLRLGPKGGYAVPMEKIHRILSWAHEATEHGGRDTTYKHLELYYSVDCFPKEFINCWTLGCRGHRERARANEDAKRLKARRFWERVRDTIEAGTTGLDSWPTDFPEDEITVRLLGLPQAEWAPADNMGPAAFLQLSMVLANNMGLNGVLVQQPAFNFPQPPMNPADADGLNFAPMAMDSADNMDFDMSGPDFNNPVEGLELLAFPQPPMNPADADGFNFAPMAMDPADNMDLDQISLDFSDPELLKYQEEWLAVEASGQIDLGKQNPFHQEEENPVPQMGDNAVAEDPFELWVDFEANADPGGDFGGFFDSPTDPGLTSGESAGGSPHTSMPQDETIQKLPDLEVDPKEFIRPVDGGYYSQAEQTIDPALLQR